MFPKILKKLRLENGLTQKELAKRLNMQNTAISKYELGEREPDITTLNELAKFFNVSVDYLLGRTNIRNQSDEISSAIEDDKELAEFWSELKEREDLQILFKQTKNLSSKGIKQVIRIIKAIEDEEDRLD